MSKLFRQYRLNDAEARLIHQEIFHRDPLLENTNNQTNPQEGAKKTIDQSDKTKRQAEAKEKKVQPLSPEQQQLRTEQAFQRGLDQHAAQIRRIDTDVARAQKQAEADSKNADFLTDIAAAGTGIGAISVGGHTEVYQRQRSQQQQPQPISGSRPAETVAKNEAAEKKVKAAAAVENPLQVAGEADRKTRTAA